MNIKLAVPAAAGAVLLMSGAAHAFEQQSSWLMQEHLYQEYQVYPHAEPYVQPYVAAAAPTTARSFDTAPSRTVTIGGEQLAESAVIGAPVVTPAGERLGKVSRIEGEGADAIVISLEDENRRASFDPSELGKAPAKAVSEPVVIGGPSAIVAADRIRRGTDGNSLVIEQSSLRTVDSKYG